MTDARLPDRWLLGPLLRVDVSAFRSFVCSLTWSVANRTDGVIRATDVRHIPGFDAADIPELMAWDLWHPHGLGEAWLIAEFRATQTSRAEHESLARKRASDRERKAKKRAEARLSGGQSHGQSTRQSAADKTRTTKDRTGQARTGTSRRNAQPIGGDA